MNKSPHKGKMGMAAMAFIYLIALAHFPSPSSVSIMSEESHYAAIAYV